MPDPNANAASANAEHGEGNYEAARTYQKAQHEFAADKDKVKKAAREAADALDGPEAAELEKARRDSANAGKKDL
jgi:hypothetical protein